MFGRKKHKTESRVQALDDMGQVLFDLPLIEIPIQDEHIRALSQEYFNDPDPCEIHKSAVRSRVMATLTELSGGASCPITRLEALMQPIWPQGAVAFVTYEKEVG